MFKIKIRLSLPTHLNMLNKTSLVLLMFGFTLLTYMTRSAEAEIAFMSGSLKNLDIFLMSPDGKDVKQLTRDPLYDADPAWSPDGKRIASYGEHSNRNNSLTA